MNNKNKLAFTFVEMIIAISIVVLLAVVGNSSLSTYKEKSNNSKVISDLSTLNNSLLSYSTENNVLPKAGGNNNFFKSDTSYAHSWTGADTFGAHGFITENTLPNKYLNYLPLDPVTSQYYAYGRTRTDLQFEVAGVILNDSQPISLVNGNYTAETGPYNLIREYNGPDFVYDKSSSVFPYNPYEKVLTAKINDFSGSVSSIKINNSTMGSGELLSYTLKKGDSIYVSTGSTVDLYFSDGTTATLGDIANNSELTLSDMSFNGKTNLFTKIKLVLGVGTIWSNATSLGSDSSFEIYTTDSSAAVRGTIFGVSKNTNTDISVLDGSVNIQQVEPSFNNITKLNDAIISDIPTSGINQGITPVDTGFGFSVFSGTQGGMGTLPTTQNVNLVSRSTLDRFGKIANAIQLNINYYRKTTNLIDIKLKLNNIIKKKAEYLKLRVGDIDYKLKNNWSHSRELTLTGGTIFGNISFSGIIQNQSKIKLAFCKVKKDGKEKCTKTKIIKLINQKYTKADIGRCPKGTKKFNHECLPEPTGELKGWELVAYAPYDEVGDINMYTKEGKTINVTSKYITPNIGGSNNGQSPTQGTCITFDIHNSFCTTNSGIKGVYGVYIDKIGPLPNTDFLSYSGKTLERNFAIEMNLSKNIFSDLGTKFLFDNNFGSGLILNKNPLGYYIKLNNKFICADFIDGKPLCNIIFSNDFEKIILINGKKLFIGGKTFILDNTFSIKIKKLFIGSNFQKINQINGIIDYLKIFKN